MKISFYKYQGTGNDFIMIDNRKGGVALSQPEIELLCNRKKGIGADGLILLELADDYDFRMVYYNSDGRQSSMCGNGGRCISHFAGFLELVNSKGNFIAIDGNHEFELLENDIVKLKMNDVLDIQEDKNSFVMDTGSPHFVKFNDDLMELDVVAEARAIRYNKVYAEKGINVNFVEVKGGDFFMRTYERGVEDETSSCGTGTVAVALSLVSKECTSDSPVEINTYGGQLKVHFTKIDKGFSDIWLQGEAKMVFKGEITL